MQKTQLHPVAEILVSAYLDTASYSRAFDDEHGQPPTGAAKVHHMRSITQARLNQTEGFVLANPWLEFGRVEFQDAATDTTYLLRSEGAVNIERSKRPQHETLFDPTQYLVTAVVLLVYKFHRHGLDLSVAGTLQPIGRTRLEASGTPTHVGTWPFSLAGPPSFDQGARDPFEDLGDLRDLGEDDAG